MRYWAYAPHGADIGSAEDGRMAVNEVLFPRRDALDDAAASGELLPSDPGFDPDDPHIDGFEDWSVSPVVRSETVSGLDRLTRTTELYYPRPVRCATSWNWSQSAALADGTRRCTTMIPARRTFFGRSIRAWLICRRTASTCC